jgi:hypothetical protein
MQVSNAKLKTYRRCPKQYEFKYVMGLVPKQRQLQLERGGWLHELLMVHNDGEDWKQRHRELTKQFENLWEEEREELGNLPGECARIMAAYLRTYKSDEQRYRVIDSELNEIVTLPNGLDLNVVVDVILEDTGGGIWLRDYKTRANFTRTENMMLDPQLTLYFWAMEHMGYKPIRGAEYDEIRTKAPTRPALLKSGGLSKAKSIDTDVYTYMVEIKRYGLDPNDYADILQHIATNQRDRFFRRTPIPKDPPVVKTTMREAVQTAQEIQLAERKQRFPRTFDNSCTWGCSYRDLCIAQLYGGDIEPMIRLQFEKGGEDGRHRRLR